MEYCNGGDIEKIFNNYKKNEIKMGRTVLLLFLLYLYYFIRKLLN
jgi:hypothetical protein